MSALFITVFIIIFIEIVEIEGTILQFDCFSLSSTFSDTLILDGANVINLKRVANVFKRALSFMLWSLILFNLPVKCATFRTAHVILSTFENKSQSSQ